MSAADAVKAASAAGIHLKIDGEDLVLEASGPPPAAVLGLLGRYKAGVVALLRPGTDGWSAEDWRAFFHERAAVLEHDHGVSHEEAEHTAYKCCVAEWANRNLPLPTDPTRGCAHCGARETVTAVVLPFVPSTTGAVWLHAACWRPWFAEQQARARAAIEVMGIRG